MYQTKWYSNRLASSDGCLNLICLPYAGGGTQIYNEWRSWLPQQVNLYPILLPGRQKRIKEFPFFDTTELVESLYTEIKPLTELPIVVFGHSLGALLGFHLVNVLIKNGVTTSHFIASGCRAPHLPYRYKGVYLQEHHNFRRTLVELGFTSPDVVENEKMFTIFENTLRADFKLAENQVDLDLYSGESRNVNTSASIFMGANDSVVTSDAAYDWHLFYKKIDFYTFPGGHFFIHEREKEIRKKVIELLNNILHELKTVMKD